MAQMEAKGVAEKRKGRKGPGSVIGSSAAGCVCAFLSIYGVGGAAFMHIWELVFVGSFCIKLSDTVSSEIGKAYGETKYTVNLVVFFIEKKLPDQSGAATLLLPLRKDNKTKWLITKFLMGMLEILLPNGLKGE